MSRKPLFVLLLIYAIKANLIDFFSLIPLNAAESMTTQTLKKIKDLLHSSTHLERKENIQSLSIISRTSNLETLLIDFSSEIPFLAKKYALNRVLNDIW